MTRPNILLIVFDTARADAFEPYGAPAGASPAVADLAASGSASPATFSTACWTMPAHMSLLSGMLPRGAGFRPAEKMADYRPQLAALAPHLLPSVLNRAGYESLGVSTNGWVSGASGFNQCFEDFVFVRGWRIKKLAAASRRVRASWLVEGLRARLDDGAEEVERRLDAWLSTRGDRPFLCFVNLVECHSPYLPPKPYNDLSPADRVRAAQEARRYLTLSSIWKCSTGGFDVPPEVLARMRHLYAASIRQLDDWLARVLEALDSRGILAETQVVVTSDHGENLGEGEMLGHAFSLDDRLLRVPLVTAGPHELPPGGLRSLRAVPGWLADVAQVDGHPFPAPAAEADVAVAQFEAPARTGDPRVGEALQAWRMDGAVAEEAARRLTTSFSCATDGSLKLIRRFGREELLDLEADPLEERPVAIDGGHRDARDGRLAPLRRALDEAAAEPVFDSAPDAERPGAEEDPLPSDEVAEIEAQMRLLGYL